MESRFQHLILLETLIGLHIQWDEDCIDWYDLGVTPINVVASEIKEEILNEKI